MNACYGIYKFTMAQSKYKRLRKKKKERKRKRHRSIYVVCTTFKIFVDTYRGLQIGIILETLLLQNLYKSVFLIRVHHIRNTFQVIRLCVLTIKNVCNMIYTLMT
jgi:hypothetical protein